MYYSANIQINFSFAKLIIRKMIQIDDKIVSFDVLEEFFLCDLKACKGVCCVDGDAGAPIEKSELIQIEDSFPFIKKYLSENSLEEIKKQGLFEVNSDGDFVTPCINGGECVYLFKDKDDIFKCAFEIANDKGEIDFQKPISCHLYPIRLSKYEKFTAVNYEERNICSAGRILGKKENLKVYRFLREPLIRALGKEWFDKLDYAAKNYKIER